MNLEEVTSFSYVQMWSPSKHELPLPQLEELDTLNTLDIDRLLNEDVHLTEDQAWEEAVQYITQVEV
jgi:hypothetical protein